VKEKQGTKEVKGMKATDQCSVAMCNLTISSLSLLSITATSPPYNGVISASIMSRILPTKNLPLIIGLLTSFLSPNFCGLEGFLRSGETKTKGAAGN
jgi:hypothetical protein